MESPIRRTIERDIGGDEQRISTVDTRYFDIRFRHLLLPVWISAYRYNDKVFRFLVNARTGEVRGERPYSAVKIALLSAESLNEKALHNSAMKKMRMRCELFHRNYE